MLKNNRPGTCSGCTAADSLSRPVWTRYRALCWLLTRCSLLWSGTCWVCVLLTPPCGEKASDTCRGAKITYSEEWFDYLMALYGNPELFLVKLMWIFFRLTWIEIWLFTLPSKRKWASLENHVSWFTDCIYHPSGKIPPLLFVTFAKFVYRGNLVQKHGPMFHCSPDYRHL
jgi:hypothetical protein